MAGGISGFIRKIPYSVLAPVALVVGFSPFFPEPHLSEKLRLLFAGELVRPIDIFDLLLHLAPVVLLIIKFFVVGTHDSDSSTM